MDRRICAACTSARPLSQKIWQIYRSGFYWRSFLLQICPIDRRILCDHHFICLRVWSDAGCWHRILPISGGRHKNRCHHRYGYRLLLCRNGRNERHNLHPGRPVLCAYICLHGTGHLHLHPDDWNSYSPTRIWRRVDRRIRRGLLARSAGRFK